MTTRSQQIKRYGYIRFYTLCKTASSVVLLLHLLVLDVVSVLVLASGLVEDQRVFVAGVKVLGVGQWGYQSIVSGSYLIEFD